MNRRITVALFCLLAINIGGLLRMKLPDPRVMVSAPFEYTHETKGYGAIDNIRVSATRETENMTTTGMFLNVDFSFTPDDKRTTTSGTLIDAKGHKISNTQLTACRRGQNGLPNNCTLVFEVLPENIEGAKVRFTGGFTEEASAVIVHDLGIDAAKAAELRKGL